MLNFKELLTNPSYLVEATSAEKDPVTPEALKEALDTAVAPHKAVVEAIKNEDVSNFEFSNLDLLKEAQSASINHYGEWNEDAAKLSLSIYLASEGTVTDIAQNEKFVPLWQLTLMPYTESTEKEVKSIPSNLTYGSFESLKKENKAFGFHPVCSFETAHNLACRNITMRESETEEKEYTSILEKYGIYVTVEKVDKTTTESVDIYPVMVEGKPFKSIELHSAINSVAKEGKWVKEDLEPIIATWAETYEFLPETFAESINLLLESMCKDRKELDFTEKEYTPVNVSVEDVLKSVTKSNEDVTARTLYSITRKLKISKEEIAEALNAYSWASTAVMEKLYTQLPDKRETQSVVDPVEKIAPIAEPGSIESVDTKEENSSTKDSKTKSGSMLALFHSMNARR